jgi:hypothetical protein
MKAILTPSNKKECWIQSKKNPKKQTYFGNPNRLKCMLWLSVAHRQRKCGVCLSGCLDDMPWISASRGLAAELFTELGFQSLALFKRPRRQRANF